MVTVLPQPGSEPNFLHVFFIDMELENGNLESNKVDAAPPMHRCDWSSEVIATEEDMELENRNLESNKEDSAPTVSVHLCDLPDEIFIIIFQYMFSLGAFNIGAVRYVWNKSQRVLHIVGDCLSENMIHICANILKKLDGDFMFRPRITCE